jgi:hypothetical protein
LILTAFINMKDFSAELNRREFLKTGAGAAAAVVASTLPVATKAADASGPRLGRIQSHSG